MPLSDREQQILADIEARLRAEDPRFARNVGTRTSVFAARRWLWLSVAALVVGFGLLFAGVLAHPAWGVAGFVLMLAGAVNGARRWQQLHADSTPVDARAPAVDRRDDDPRKS